MTDNKATETAKATLAANKKTREAQDEQYETLASSKPTPTQEENDLAALGVHMAEHEPDGSPETALQPATQQSTKQVEAKRGQSNPGAYQTRTSSAKPD